MNDRSRVGWRIEAQGAHVTHVMRIGITGATGFIGRHLCRLARERGHEVVCYSRRASNSAGDLQQPARQPWNLPEPEEALDALVHLAGESVFGLWTAAKRARIRDSRVAFTEKMVAHLSCWRRPPPVLLAASGVGFYGDRGDEILNEASSGGEGFLAGVCRDWEAAAAGAEKMFDARVVTLRTGLVLGADGGALPLMRRAFALGLGGRLGSGRQWMPWIHLADEVGLILFAVENPALSGPLNLTAPNPVTNAGFTRALAAALRRPAFLHAPALAIRALLGGMGREMLLSGQRALPAAAVAAGYRFVHPELAPALVHVLAR